MLYKDTTGKMNVADPTLAAANVNLGLQTRQRFNKNSKVIKMMEPIFCDVVMTKCLLLSFVDLKINLNQSCNQFCLMASEDDVDYREKLTEAYLKLKEVQVSSRLLSPIYPVRSIQC